MPDADEDFSLLLKFPPDYPLADLYVLSERLTATDVGDVPPAVGTGGGLIHLTRPSLQTS